MTAPIDPETRSERPYRWSGALIIVLLLLGASLYAFGGLGNLIGGKAPENAHECAAARAKISKLKPLARGEIAGLQLNEAPMPVMRLTFQNAGGETIALESFRGRTVLLNLWATWCVPCRKEMPALDSLQKTLGGPDFEVVAVNIDTRNPEKPGAFLDEIGVRALHRYADPKARIFQDLKAAGRAFGMPTTLLIDPEGCELASLAGPAEWSSADAILFVREAKAR